MSNRFAGTAEAQPVDFGALGAAMSGLRGGFAERASFTSAPEPKHFSPANPGFNPTAGWDPFDPMGEQAKEQAPAEPDLVGEAHAQGFAEGVAAAERMAAERGEVDAQALAQIATSLDGLSNLGRDALAERLRETVTLLVTRLVGEVGVSTERMRGRIDTAATLLVDSVEAATLKLHPDDLALIEGHVPAGMTAIADPAIERGGFRMETRTSAIGDSPSSWLAQLAAALDRVPLTDG